MSSKPDVTLQPSKAVVTEVSARIYAAYILSGRVEEKDTDQWIRRSIREAIAIARTVDRSVQSDDELPSGEPAVLQPSGEQETSDSEDSDLEELAEEVLLSHASPPPSDEPKTSQPKQKTTKKTSKKAAKKPVSEADSSNDAAQAATEKLKQVR